MTHAVSKRPSLPQRMALMQGWTTEVVIDAPQQTVREQRDADSLFGLARHLLGEPSGLS